MVTLKNNDFIVEINPKGAELNRLYNQALSLDYLWNGDAAFWAKKSPILFPIVGQLKNNTYIFSNKEYHLPRHGFARDKTFVVEHKENNKVTFLLEQDEDTLQVYPFCFQLRVHYTLTENKITITYDIYNRGNDNLLFSIGGHPAFATDLVPGADYNDYYLELEHLESAPRYGLQDNLIGEPTPFLKYDSHIPLAHDLFYKDAIVLKNLQSTHISLKNRINEHGLTVSLNNFPYLGIWAAKEAPFVCIEPWCGIADSIYHNQQFEDKEGIIALSSQHRWQNEWSISCF